MKRKIISLLFIIVIWQGLALLINKVVILPLPIMVFIRIFELVTSSSFYYAVLATISRVFVSFVIALIIGTMLGIISGLNKHIKEYIEPLISLLSTIPQIAYILILLVWFKSTTALLVIVLLMIIPIFYYNSVNGIINIDQELKDVISLYHHSFTYNLIKVYLPLIKGYIISAIQTCLPLSLKVGVMAEIFVSSKQGIGKQLYFARVQIDMISIFAWTILMILIINLLTYLMNKLLRIKRHT